MDRCKVEKERKNSLADKINELSNDIKIKQQLCDDATANLAKEKNVNANLIKENKVLSLNLKRATDLILENKRFRAEAEDLLLESKNLLQKSLIDVTCQTDIAGDNATNIISHIEEISIKKVQLDKSIVRIMETTPNSNGLKRRLERCDTIPPLPRREQNDNSINDAYDSDIEFVEERQGPRASTSEK
uniref:Uncharacterized protein n=1 Tax=Meloidogyne incognita TaxID=6306 RepID=A0A914MQ67_MELIC